MVHDSLVCDLEKRIEEKLEYRKKLMESFVDAPGIMQSRSDHTRQDLATEIAVVDELIQELRGVIAQLQGTPETDVGVVGAGHIVRLQIDDEEPESFLLLAGRGGLQLDDMSIMSINTPVGQAILGKKAGDRASVDVPRGQLEIRILAVE